jgi:hypothetical protein
VSLAQVQDVAALLDDGPLSVALARIAHTRGADEHRSQDAERDY